MGYATLLGSEIRISVTKINQPDLQCWSIVWPHDHNIWGNLKTFLAQKITNTQGVQEGKGHCLNRQPNRPQSQCTERPPTMFLQDLSGQYSVFSIITVLIFKRIWQI